MIEYPIIKNLLNISDEEKLLDFADIEEALRLGIAVPKEVIPGKGILIYIGSGDVYILSAVDDDTADKLLSLLPEDGFYVLCVHGEKAISKVKSSMNDLMGEETYYQFVYPGSADDISAHMVCNEGYTLSICHPGDEYFKEVIANYDLVPEEDLRMDFEDPSFLAGFTDGEMACFIGRHREGAMGLLRVFPQYRRRGYAEKIYSTLIYEQIKRGALPYCQVDVTNDASIHLQNKLGFLKAAQPVGWFVKEE
ncbi:MAG: GNAT family N-acetyltransferase [Firmicutes bacterium]|nr:GNAT family N-acetyltransferase [Bacillota bacterium]